MNKNLAIIAGAGALPVSLIQACQSQGISPFVVGLLGCVTADLPCDIILSVTRPAAIMATLKKQKITHLIMIGAVRRPALADIGMGLLDFRNLAYLKYLKGGDDALLRSIRAIFEAADIQLLGAHHYMPDALCPTGILGKHAPTTAQWRDIKIGMHAAQTLGQLDIGQSVAVYHEQVLAVEGIEGTAALIARTADLKPKDSTPLLIKCAKPTQDLDLDLPTIGVDTIKQLHAAGFGGLALQAQKTFIVNPMDVVQAANEYGMVVIGI